jgi:hypothetical protein
MVSPTLAVSCWSASWPEKPFVHTHEMMVPVDGAAVAWANADAGAMVGLADANRGRKHPLVLKLCFHTHPALEHALLL